MRQYSTTWTRKPGRSRKRITEWMLYLPGGLLLLYGLWLSVTS